MKKVAKDLVNSTAQNLKKLCGSARHYIRYDKQRHNFMLFNLLRKLKKMSKYFDETSKFEYETKDYMESKTPENPKVSVIVPVYNAADYIERCLHYLVMQTIKDIEIIVINDGSTDNSPELIKKFADIDKRIIIINQENKLQGAARNIGLKIAKGEYIGFCDADDYVNYDYYEKLYNAVKKYNSDIALAENIRISETKYKPRLNINKEEVFTDIPGKLYVCNQHKNECPTNKIYRKKMFDTYKIDFPEGVYCEDKLFSIKAVYYANKIVTVPNIHYYYWENPKSTVNSKKTKKHIMDKINAKKAVLNFVKEKKIPVENWYFTAEKKIISVFGIPLFIIKESTKTERGYLFGFIKLFEKAAEENLG